MVRVKSVQKILRERQMYSTWREYNAKTRVYVSIENKTILENLVNRRQRPVAVFRDALNTLPELQGKKFKWSQKAGCSCGCSPGFIVQNEHSGIPYDLFVTVE